jgi:hypothetical protein
MGVRVFLVCCLFVGVLGVWVFGSDMETFCKNFGGGGLGGFSILGVSVMTKRSGIWRLAAVYISLVGWVFGGDCTIGDVVTQIISQV